MRISESTDQHGSAPAGSEQPTRSDPAAQPSAQDSIDDHGVTAAGDQHAAASGDVVAERSAVPPIVIDQLTKDYGQVRAVDQLSMTVEPGRITGFLGPNGAGKTTTLRILLGLATATAGSATFGGAGYVDLAHPQYRVGAVMDPSFHPGRSGRNHLRVLGTTARVGMDRIDALLELVGLTAAADRRVGGYSLGMKQRLALAGALLGDPDYLVLDEPANGLDPEGIRWLRGFLRSFAEQGRVVLMSSHILNEVEATVDDVVVIGHGRAIVQAPIEELPGSRTARIRVADPAAAEPVLDRLGLGWHRAEDPNGPCLRADTADLATIGTALFEAGLAVQELAAEQVDLESEFFSLVGGQQ